MFEICLVVRAEVEYQTFCGPTHEDLLILWYGIGLVISETAVRADVACSNPLEDKPTAVRNGTDKPVCYL